MAVETARSAQNYQAISCFYRSYWDKKSNNSFPRYLPAFTVSISEPLLNVQTASYIDEMQWNKCPKRGFMTTGLQIPIEKHYRSLHSSPKEMQL